MSSNSCADPVLGPTAALLARALAELGRSSPTHTTLLSNALRALALRIEVAGEAFSPVVTEAGVGVGPPAGAADVVVRSSVRCIVALLDGRLDLPTAVSDRRLALWGTVDDLLDAFEAFRIFLHGLVRSPAGPVLFEETRRLAARGEAHGEAP